MSPELLELAKAGGLALFAVSVWWELRTQRQERREDEKARDARDKELTETLSELRTEIKLQRQNKRAPTQPQLRPFRPLTPP